MEKIAAGVYKLRIGIPEEFTPTRYRKAEPKLNKIDALPVSVSGGFYDSELKWEKTMRGLHISLPMQGDEDIYGLGLQLFGMNQAGLRRFMKVNSDPPVNSGESHAPCPFYISSAGYGLFIDTFRNVEYHMGTNSLKGDSSHMTSENEEHEEFSEETLYSLRKFKGKRKITIDIPAAKGVDIYFFEGNISEITKRYILFSGGGCIPPLWGLGVWYRTYGGSDKQKVLDMASSFRKDEMPIEVLGLEPGWQSHTYSCSYKWSKDFPDADQMILDLKADGFKINLWEHAYVYPTAPFYEDIYKYCGDTEVWNGLIPDFSLDECSDIFGKYHLENFVNKGISGFKMDECDNSDYNLSNWSYPAGTRFPSGMDGEQMHNAMGILYQNVILKIFEQADTKTYSQVRSSGALSSALPFVLYSDLYDHKQYIRGLTTSGFSGMLWCPEVRDCTDGKDLLRRLETVMFSSHALINSWRIPSPPWKQVDIEKNLAGEEMAEAAYYTDECRKLMNDRMQLIPYLYTAFVEYERDGVPPIRSLVFDYPYDGRVREVDDQYLFGQSMMVCPLTREDGTSRKVYFPEGRWFHYFTKEQYEGGRTYDISADYDEIPIFVKDGSIIPLAKPVLSINEDTVFDITVHAFGEGGADFTLYRDSYTYTEDASEIQGSIRLFRNENDDVSVAQKGICARYNITGIKYWRQETKNK